MRAAATLPVIVDYGRGEAAAAESREADLAGGREESDGGRARRGGVRGGQDARPRVLALAHGARGHHGSPDGARGRRGPRRPRRPRARDDRPQRRTDPRAPGVGSRVRRHGHHRCRARHRARRRRIPTSQGVSRRRRPTSAPTRRSPTATATAPTSPRRSPAPVPARRACTEASRRAPSCSIGKVLDDDGFGEDSACWRAWSGRSHRARTSST